MLTVRKAEDRGASKLEWLDSRHTFSFADYYDPAHMGFRQLRVLNEDRVQAGKGFPTHSHQDMEIITYVLKGALEHRDSLGNGSVIRPGEVQRMSAGRGITHSEFNASQTELVHFLQIWILPEQADLVPSYEQKTIDLSAARGSLSPIASRRGGPGVVKLHQDGTISVAFLERGESLRWRPPRERYAWLQVARGAIALNEHGLSAGDGAGADHQSELRIEAHGASEILLFDLA
jgi:redox-sensitive bicupin YhaK (pirin superfamily)